MKIQLPTLLLCLLMGFAFQKQTSPLQQGKSLYNQHCASCHGQDRRGKLAPPLLPPSLKKYKNSQLQQIIQSGIPATAMPPHPQLNLQQIQNLILYLKSPPPPNPKTWNLPSIQQTKILQPNPKHHYPIQNPYNITALVERGTSRIWIMENLKILDTFQLPNVHGGIKFLPNHSALFVPCRDGWIAKYDLQKKYYAGKIQTGTYLRNIAISPNGKYLFAATWNPPQITILLTKNLTPIQTIPVPGKISAIYTLYHSQQILFTLRNQPLLATLNTQNFSLNYHKLQQPIHDFFIEPREQFLIGTSRKKKTLHILQLSNLQEVASYPTKSMPHLFSAAFWYKKGKFYFATPHINQNYLTVWQMYNWKFVKKIYTSGKGFFVRTHPNTNYLWADNGNDQITLIHKNDLSVKKLIPAPGKRALHTGFSANGKYAYVSVFDKNGALVIYDAATLQKVKQIPANLPLGKYNLINKSPQYQLPQLGYQVFMEKCWGCHHPTQEAFGPSFQKIALSRKETWIRAQIANPQHTAKLLGYPRNAMPKIPLTPAEIDALVAFIQQCTPNGIYHQTNK